MEDIKSLKIGQINRNIDSPDRNGFLVAKKIK
jgi:hypothetical protein